MSIAISAQIKPSKLLSIMTSGMGALAILSLVLAACGDAVFSFSARLVVACLGGVCVLLLCVHWMRQQTVMNVLIDDGGQLWLQKMREKAGQSSHTALQCHLLPVSTLWPYLMILHLQDASGSRRVLLVLRDSVSKEEFHGLLVACRWLSMRSSQADAGRIRDN